MARKGDDILLGSQVLTSKENPDSDGDGISDLQERLDGTDPDDASDLLQPDPALNPSEVTDPRLDLERESLERETTFDPAAAMPEGTTIDTSLAGLTNLDGTDLTTGSDHDLGFGDVEGPGLVVNRDPLTGVDSGPSTPPSESRPDIVGGNRWGLVSDNDDMEPPPPPEIPDGAPGPTPEPPPLDPEPEPEPSDPTRLPKDDPDPTRLPKDAQTNPDADGGGSGPYLGGSSGTYLGDSPVTNTGRGDLDSGLGDITGEIQPRNVVGPDVNPDAATEDLDATQLLTGAPDATVVRMINPDSGGGVLPPSAPPPGQDGGDNIGQVSSVSSTDSGPGTQTEDEVFVGVQPKGGSTVASSGGDDDDLEELEVQRRPGPVDQQIGLDADTGAIAVESFAVDHTAGFLGGDGLQQMDGSMDLGGLADSPRMDIDVGLAPEEVIEDDPGAFGGPLDDGFD